MTKRIFIFQAFTHTLLLILLFSSVSCVLQFNQQGEFTILQLTDQHYCESIHQDQATQILTRNLLEWVEPDFVVFSGDAVSGYGPGSSNPGFFHGCWERFLQPVMEYEIPYGYLLGNHDDEGDLDRKQIVKLDQLNPLSVRSTSEGIPETSTFYVPIYSSKDKSQLAANIWMFDSGRVGCDGHDNSWGCIERYQLKWYDQQSKKLKDQYGENVHHLAFSHIPIPEYMHIYNNEEIYGNSGEKISCSTANTGVFDHILKNGDISAMFLGHDHRNDFGGWYKGVELVYGRKSGYGGYGDLLGGRVIKLKEEVDQMGKVKVTREHYVVNEDGVIEESKAAEYRQGEKQAQCQMLHPQMFFIHVSMFVVSTVVIGLIVRRYL